MATREEIQSRLAAIDQKKADALKVLQAKRVKLKAKLAELDRPTRSQRREDARRKILLGAFVLEQLERSGVSLEGFTFEGKRFFEWLVRPTDRAVFDAPLIDTSPAPAATPAIAGGTALKVPFADKDRAKALGALWQPDKKRWVVPAGLDLAPFKAWLE